MKKFIFSSLIALITATSWCQIITSTPAIVTKDYAGEITVVFDAAQGTGGLKDYTGTVYAHTGVILASKPGGKNWQFAPTWGDNSAKYKLSSLGNNKWQLKITPDMKTYYGFPAGETVDSLAFVFRSGETFIGTDGKPYYKEGKDIGGTDIFIKVYSAGLNVSITNPVNKVVVINTAETVQVASTLAANLELFVNGTSVKTAASATALTYPVTYSQAIDYALIAKATANGVSVYDTAYVTVPAAVVTQPRPAGANLGINYIDNTTATLVLHAPGKSNVFLIGDMNKWIQSNAYQLKKDGDYWWITLTGLTPQKLYGFQYLVDNAIRIADPYTELILDPWNDSYISPSIFSNIKPYPSGKTTGLVGTLQTAKSPYNWEVSNFTFTNQENAVIYELLLRDFTTEKSLNAAIAKLDYLKTLGITAVELMPIQEFNGNNSWGYNPNAYFAPDKAYGTPGMYKKFIDECHKRGMAVILDMVFNQANGLHPFALLYWDSANNRPAANNPWMNPVAPHGFSVLDDFNHSSTYTRDYFKRVLQYWLTEYKVDGYRMDLTKGFTQNSGTEGSYDASRIGYLNEYYNAAKAAKSNVMFILEHFVGGQEEVDLANVGMYLWRNMNTAYSQSASGWNDITGGYADFSGMNTLPRRWVGYAESHDEQRNFYKAKMYGNGNIKTDSIVRVARVPLNMAFTVLTPGPKMIWQFGEIGYDYSGGNGDTSEKPTAFGWLNLAHRKAAYDACSKIISLRKAYPVAFTAGNYALNVASSDWDQGKRIALTHSDLNMVMLGNFKTTQITANPNFQKQGVWYELLTGQPFQVSNTSMTMTLNPGEVKIFTDRVITGVEDIKITVNCSIYPTFTSDKIWITTPSYVKQVIIYNTQGAVQKTILNSEVVDVKDLSGGMYLMEISTEQGKAVRKFVKN